MVGCIADRALRRKNSKPKIYSRHLQITLSLLSVVSRIENGCNKIQQRGLGSRSYNNCLIRRPIKFEIGFISVPLNAPFGCTNGYQFQNLPCNKLGSTFSSPVNLICKLVTLAFSSLALRLPLTASIGN